MIIWFFLNKESDSEFDDKNPPHNSEDVKTKLLSLVISYVGACF